MSGAWIAQGYLSLMAVFMAVLTVKDLFTRLAEPFVGGQPGSPPPSSPTPPRSACRCYGCWPSPGC